MTLLNDIFERAMAAAMAIKVTERLHKRDLEDKRRAKTEARIARKQASDSSPSMTKAEYAQARAVVTSIIGHAAEAEKAEADAFAKSPAGIASAILNAGAKARTAKTDDEVDDEDDTMSDDPDDLTPDNGDDNRREFPEEKRKNKKKVKDKEDEKPDASALAQRVIAAGEKRRGKY